MSLLPTWISGMFTGISVGSLAVGYFRDRLYHTVKRRKNKEDDAKLAEYLKRIENRIFDFETDKDES